LPRGVGPPILALMKIWPIALAIALHTAGCGKDKEAAPPGPPPGDGIQVITAGNEPRQVLRYKVAQGTTSQLELALDVDIDAAGQGGPLPTLVMTSEVVAEVVLPDGSMKMRTTIGEVTARERAGSPVTAEQMAEQTRLMTGLVLRGSLSPDGTLRDLEVDTAGKVLPPGITAQLETLGRSFEQVAMPLPTTPVGVGASWIHKRHVDQNGMKMLTATTFTLTALAGDVVTFQSATVVSGKDQTVTQGTQTLDLKNISGKGTGNGTVDLSRMSMTGELAAEMTSDMSAQGETTRMTMKMVTRVQPAPPAPPAPTGAP